MVFPTGGWEQEDTWKLEREQARREASTYWKSQKATEMENERGDVSGRRFGLIKHLCQKLLRR